MSSSFVCESPRRLWTNNITVGIPARATSAASWRGPLGSRCEVPGHLLHGLVGELDELGVEEDRLDAPDLLPFDLDVLLGREPLARLLGLPEHRGELRRVEMALVEEHGAGLDDRGDDSRPRHAAPHRADRSVAGALGDLADVERELRRRGQRVAALVHRSRAGVGRLAPEGDLVAFDPEGAEDDAERDVHRLEHGPLLDVELQVGGGVLELGARVQRRIELDALAREHVGERIAVGVAARAELVLVFHRSCGRARAEQAAAEPGSLLVCPVDEANGDRRPAFLGYAAQDLDPRDDVEGSVEPASVGNGVDVAADEERLLGGSCQREPLVSGLVGLLGDAEWLELPGEPFARPHPRVRPGDALGALLVARELAELVQLFDGAARLKRHGGQLYKLPSLMGRGSRPIKRWRNDRQRKKKERARRRAAEKKAK